MHENDLTIEYRKLGLKVADLLVRDGHVIAVETHT